MQIVIDIPEELYVHCVNMGIKNDEHVAIANGTPLPKGHGRLIDADERRTEIDEEDRWVVDNAPTVIEASESEDKE